MTGYVTRDKDGLLLLHYHYPVRNTDEEIWVSDGSIYLGFNQELDEKEFDNIKWENEPIEFEVIRKRKRNDHMEKLGNITLINDDCMNVLCKLPDKCFDLAIADPPYGIKINESIGKRRGMKHSKYKKAYWDNETPSIEYFNELFRISKNQIIWGANFFISKMPYDSSCWIIWDKIFSEKVTFSQFEMAWTSFKTTCKKFEKSPTANDKFKFHPTQKPVDLYKWLLKNYAKPGDKILDTHLGSGSICIACDEMGFEMTGIELDSEYYEGAKKRLKTHQLQMKLNFNEHL